MTSAAMFEAVRVPVTTKSSDNGREHPMVRHRRVKRERAVTALYLQACLDVRAWKGRRVTRILLTRFAPRSLDTGNLPSSMKGVQDEVCKVLELDDSQRGGIDWRYAQAKTVRGDEAVVVAIETDGAARG